MCVCVCVGVVISNVDVIEKIDTKEPECNVVSGVWMGNGSVEQCGGASVGLYTEPFKRACVIRRVAGSRAQSHTRQSVHTHSSRRRRRGGVGEGRARGGSLSEEDRQTLIKCLEPGLTNCGDRPSAAVASRLNSIRERLS